MCRNVSHPAKAVGCKGYFSGGRWASEARGPACLLSQLPYPVPPGSPLHPFISSIKLSLSLLILIKLVLILTYPISLSILSFPSCFSIIPSLYQTYLHQAYIYQSYLYHNLFISFACICQVVHVGRLYWLYWVWRLALRIGLQCGKRCFLPSVHGTVSAALGACQMHSKLLSK